MNVSHKPHLHQDWIDPHAFGIVRTLQKAGHTTYLVGGCVRDLLLNIHPKDFDIATTARPNEVKRLIHRAYVIGKRFRLVLVRREEQQFEVSTFRREVTAEELAEENPDGDNLFGSPEEDANRRDFTINGLFYDPVGDELIDYAAGLPDLEARLIRMIGDPVKRLVEDPIRILRALRLRHMIGFSYDHELRSGMQSMASSLPTTVLPRRREEILKLLRLKDPSRAFLEAMDLGILPFLSPTLAKYIEGPGGDVLLSNLSNLEKAATPAELFANLVHCVVRSCVRPEPEAGSRELLGDEMLQSWMRDELGMFKFEQANAMKAFQLESLLGRRKDFQKRGDRRQRALLANEAFAIALNFARNDYFLSGDDLMYWNELFERYKATTADDVAPRERTRGRRRRSRRDRSKSSPQKREEVRS
jgi:poly(A) polymerase